jgi:glutamyl-tRNA synthetase
MTVRTRVAPSPTGDPHVGTAYIALFNYCFAKKHGGEFILRIEDTDQERSTYESEMQILNSLKWAGLTWDEGPDIGGSHGPYRQSERGDLYAKHTQILLDKNEAFRCFCTGERLDELRKEQMSSGTGKLGYDGHCLTLSDSEIQTKLKANTPHVVRLKVPREGVCRIHDLLRGEIEIAWSEVDMQVLLKSDGMPTYHLANVVDDHHMKITHVIRGEEWINSAPKHLRLYEAFGWTPPTLCHLPLLRNPDKSKLSKRKNPTSIHYYQKIGILPEALLNYLGRMAWSMPNDEEKFSVEEMIKHFDLDRISLGGPIFDVEKLNWLSGRWIRENHNTEELAHRLMEWALNPTFLQSILPMLQPRLERLSDIGKFAGYFLSGHLELTSDQLSHKKLNSEQINQALIWAMWRLDELTAWTSEAISNALRECATELDLKPRDFFAPFYPAITGMKSATPLFDTMEVLGKDLVRARLRDASKLLGGVSKKGEARWKKTYEQGRKARLESLSPPIETP